MKGMDGTETERAELSSVARKGQGLKKEKDRNNQEPRWTHLRWNEKYYICPMVLGQGSLRLTEYKDQWSR